MNGVRWLQDGTERQDAPCSRCQATGCPWDHLAGEPICPDCQDSLVRDEGPPLIARVQPSRCVVCSQRGVLRYLTVPRNGLGVIELDLCGAHLQAFLRRRLDRIAFRQLSSRLDDLGVGAREVFLLHEAFYDDLGHPLQPVPECN